MTVKHAHCLFEQSGTFKHEFERLSIPAKDYDLCNDFGETDWQGDLFSQIELAFLAKESIFDFFAADDLVFAFFLVPTFAGIMKCSFAGLITTIANYRAR